MQKLPNVNFVRSCRECGKKVWFSDDVIGKNGSRVPMERDGSRHVCAEITEEARIARIVNHVAAENSQLKRTKLSLVREDLDSI